MEKFSAHIGKYGIWYTLGALALGVLIAYNWETIQSWFPSGSPSTERRATSANANRYVCYKYDSSGKCETCYNTQSPGRDPILVDSTLCRSAPK